MKNIAIIGASYLQLPLIRKAKEMGLKTHVFAWNVNDVGEKEADYFYPISVIEKEQILNKCKEIGIDGICSISSDVAMLTVNYVAQNMGLISNNLDCTNKSTNKHLMRKCFEKNNDPSPKSLLVESINDLKVEDLSFPLIVKPIDRSGSRGITKVYKVEELEKAIENAKEQGFDKKALVEEYVKGIEYSVECVSFEGEHHFLQMTYKYTTGSPNYIETGHLEPAPVSKNILEKVKKITFHALDSLKIKYGASHTELKIDSDESIKLIEIGGRMGGDFIGSDLVKNTTGFDFVEAVINISLGIKPVINLNENEYSAVRFIFSKDDINVFNKILKENPELIKKSDIPDQINDKVTNSSNRSGYFIISGNKEDVYKYLLTKPIEI